MSIYKKLLEGFNEMCFLYVVLGIIASSCVGSIAATLALVRPTNIFLLCLSVATAMWFNATVLAQLSKKIVLNSLLISLVVNALIIIIQL